MKHPTHVFALICCSIMLLGGVAHAQDGGHVYVIRTYNAVIPDGGTAEERDSMVSEFVEAVWKKNKKIISSKHLRHAYGRNSHDWIVITEYATFADIAEAGKINDQLEEKKWPDDKKRSEFFQRIGKYFPSHSEEIFNGLPKFEK